MGLGRLMAAGVLLGGAVGWNVRAPGYSGSGFQAGAGIGAIGGLVAWLGLSGSAAALAHGAGRR